VRECDHGILVFSVDCIFRDDDISLDIKLFPVSCRDVVENLLRVERDVVSIELKSIRVFDEKAIGRSVGIRHAISFHAIVYLYTDSKRMSTVFVNLFVLFSN